MAIRSTTTQKTDEQSNTTVELKQLQAKQDELKKQYKELMEKDKEDDDTIKTLSDGIQLLKIEEELKSQEVLTCKEKL